MNDQAKLKALIVTRGPTLEIGWADPVCLLASLAEIESAFGLLAIPKHEKAYDWGGTYFNRALWSKWGSWAACSYSSFQIMFPAAVELGFSGSPMDLWDDEIAIHWVIDFIQKRILDKGASTLEQFADAYNSGSCKDAFVPTEYITRFVASYGGIAAKRKLYEGGINA